MEGALCTDGGSSLGFRHLVRGHPQLRFTAYDPIVAQGDELVLGAFNCNTAATSCRIAIRILKQQLSIKVPVILSMKLLFKENRSSTATFS
jgi:hypothetical protein